MSLNPEPKNRPHRAHLRRCVGSFVTPSVTPFLPQGMRVVNIVGFRRGYNFLSELLGLATPFGKVVKHLVLDLRAEVRPAHCSTAEQLGPDGQNYLMRRPCVLVPLRPTFSLRLKRRLEPWPSSTAVTSRRPCAAGR